ncbi:hypothetical protein K501DRAFT_280296 [Backusella circina FSU 941]|nr:hypothetical protein K501DRAFT_280296 [Backusella circina FSU 941]
MSNTLFFSIYFKENRDMKQVSGKNTFAHVQPLHRARLEYTNASLILNKIVKAYRRSAAGNEQLLPSNARSVEPLVVNNNKMLILVFEDLVLKFHSLAQRNNEILETASRRNKATNVHVAQNFLQSVFQACRSIVDTLFNGISTGIAIHRCIPASCVETILGYEMIDNLWKRLRRPIKLVEHKKGDKAIKDIVNDVE